jgi:hypothetical protein
MKKIIFVFGLLFLMTNGYASSSHQALLNVDEVEFPMQSDLLGRKWVCDAVTFDPKRFVISLSDSAGNNFFARLEGFESDLLSTEGASFSFLENEEANLSIFSLSKGSETTRTEFDSFETDSNCVFSLKLIEGVGIGGEFQCKNLLNVDSNLQPVKRGVRASGTFTCPYSRS